MQQNSLVFERELTRRARLHYLLYLPENYSMAERVPLLIFLHGLGERGDDPERMLIHGLPKVVRNGHELPFIVLAPQCHSDTTWVLQVDALNALLDEILESYHVDVERVYLTGLSMGGYGTWNWAASNPERFAAIAPICGGGSWLFGFPQKVCALRDLPVWTFHGAKDKVIPIRESEVLVKALKECGGNVRFTIYADAEHDSWTRTYDNPELYTWFLQHRKK